MARDKDVLPYRGRMRASDAMSFNGSSQRPMGNTGARAGLEIIDPIGWAGRPVPERQWTVERLVPAGNVTMLSGDGGLGKSLIAQQLLTAAAVGGRWLDRDTRPCRALGIFCEDDADELHRRQVDICRSYDCSLGDLEHMNLVSRVGMDNLLIEFPSPFEAGDPTALAGQIMNHALDFGAELVVLDSLHDFFGGNENSRPHARQFINSLRDIALEIQGSVVLCAHPSKDGLKSGDGSAGSTAWNNAVRSRLYLHRPEPEEGEEPDADERILTTKKLNYGRVGEGINLLWRDGAFVVQSVAGGRLEGIENSIAERVFLKLLENARTNNRPLSDNKQAGNFAPRVFGKSPNREGLKRSDFERAMERLFSQDVIHMVNYGRAGDTRQRIELKDLFGSSDGRPDA